MSCVDGSCAEGAGDGGAGDLPDISTCNEVGEPCCAGDNGGFCTFWDGVSCGDGNVCVEGGLGDTDGGMFGGGVPGGGFQGGGFQGGGNFAG